MEAIERLRTKVFGTNKLSTSIVVKRVAIALAIAAVAVVALKGRLYANVGISTDKHVFWYSPGPLHVHDFVTFTLIHPLLPHPAEVVKEVRCVAGQNLRVTDKAAYCDGQYLGPKKPKTLDGRPMPKFTFDGVIPAGQVFLMNPHKDSFDSRYYGLKPVKDMKRLVALF